MASRPGPGGRLPNVAIDRRPTETLKPLGGTTRDGRFRINARRITLPAAEAEWRSRAVRKLPPNTPITRRPDRCVGGIVLEVEPAPMPADDFWWYHAEVIAVDLPQGEITPTEFFTVPPHLPGEAFPPPDRMPPVIVLVRLVPAAFSRWLGLLDAAPYPALVLDEAAGTATLELSDLA